MVIGQAADDYHDQPAIGASGLKRLQVTPAHYWADFLDPERERRDKKHFRIGRAWHCAVFEPEEFGKRYAAGHDAHPATTRAKLLAECLAAPSPSDWLMVCQALPEGLSRTSKEGKALVADIEAAGGRALDAEDLDWITAWAPKLIGRDVLSADSLAGVKAMAAIARSLPISRVVFENMAGHGHAEVSLYATDPATGVRLKIRPDYMLEPCEAFPDGLIIDGKSTTDAGDGFGRQVWNLDYGFQAALYPRVYQQVFGTRRRPAYLWLAQEKDSPFACRYYAAGDDLQAHYDRRIDRLLPVFAECQQRGQWPGYPADVQTLAMPAYAEKQMADAA